MTADVASSQNAEPDSTDPAAPKPRRSWKRRIARCVWLYVAVPYLVITVGFTLFQRRLLYPASRLENITIQDANVPGGAIHAVQIQSDGDVTLNGWLTLPQDRDGDTVQEATASRTPDDWLLIYFPGNSGNRLDRVAECREFSRLGMFVLLFDYRGYGDNVGSPSEKALSSDARRIWKFATDDLNFSADRIVIFGESLGGAVATRLAAEQSMNGNPPAGLVLSSTFASLSETVGWHYPYFPFRYTLFDRYPSADRIRAVRCPLLVFHGTEDDFVPLEHGRRLFEAAPAESTSGVSKQFVELRGALHNGIPTGVLRSKLSEFLEEL